MERGPIQQEKLTESTLEEDDDQKEEEEEVVNVRQQQQRQQQRRRRPQPQLGLAGEREGRLRLPFDRAICLQVLLPVLEHKLRAVLQHKTNISTVSDESGRLLVP